MTRTPRSPAPKCGATAKSTGEPCKRGAGAGTDHKGFGRCSKHGGSSPGGKKQGLRLEVDAAAAASLAKYRHQLADAGPVENPLTEILKLAGESLAWLAALRDRAQTRLDEDRLASSSEQGERVAVDIELYERAMRQAKEVLGLAATKKVEERLTAIAERDLARVEAAYRVVWQAGRDGLDLEEARRRAARHLRPVA